MAQLIRRFGVVSDRKVDVFWVRDEWGVHFRNDANSNTRTHEHLKSCDSADAKSYVIIKFCFYDRLAYPSLHMSVVEKIDSS